MKYLRIPPEVWMHVAAFILPSSFFCVSLSSPWKATKWVLSVTCHVTYEVVSLTSLFRPSTVRETRGCLIYRPGIETGRAGMQHRETGSAWQTMCWFLCCCPAWMGHCWSYLHLCLLHTGVGYNLHCRPWWTPYSNGRCGKPWIFQVLHISILLVIW